MKITVIGAGNVGGLAAMRIAGDNPQKEICLIDIVPGLARGKAFDLEDCRQILNTAYQIEGTDDISRMEGSQIIVITAGLARKPGMTREELLNNNARILKGICAKVKTLAPEAVVIIVTNPLDNMTYYAGKILGFNRHKVFGMGVTLDGSRFANLISQEIGIPASEINPVVLGSHGEAMLPLPRFTLVRNNPLTAIIKNPDQIQSLIQKTVERGKEIVALLGSGSAYFAPSAAIAQIVNAIVNDEKKALGVSAYLDGEYGLKDICVGVPCIIGKGGIGKIVELDLDHKEKKTFFESAESIRKLNTILCMI